MSMLQVTKKRLRKLQFSRREKLAFLEDLSTLVDDGVVATQAIEAMSQVSNEITRTVAHDINLVIASGQGLAEGMKPWFPHTVYEIVRAGEESGTLNQSISVAAQSFKRGTNAIKELVHSIFYPITVFITSLVLLIFVKKTVLQSFLQIKPYDQWPMIGQHLFHFGYLMQTWWWFCLALIALIIIGLVMMLRTATGKIRNYIDKIPLLSLYRDVVAAQLMETLGLLLSNGVIMKQAFNILQKDAPPYLAWHLLMMEFRLSGGKDNIADVLDTQLISENNLVRLKLMAQGKGIEQALINLGRNSNRQTIEHIGRIGRIAGAIFLILTALVAVFIVAGIYNISSVLAMM